MGDLVRCDSASFRRLFGEILCWLDFYHPFLVVVFFVVARCDIRDLGDASLISDLDSLNGRGTCFWNRGAGQDGSVRRLSGRRGANVCVLSRLIHCYS